MVYWPQMRELLSARNFEIGHAQQPIELAITRFCAGKDNPNTKAAYESDLRDFSNFAVEANVTQLDQLNAEFIGSYLERCEISGLSRKTIRRRVASLAGLLTQESMEELARETKSVGYKRAGSTKEIKMQPFRPLNIEEAERLQEVSKGNSRNAAFIAIALGTGANVAEILALRANNIFETDDQISVGFGGKHGRIAKLGLDASAIVKKHIMESGNDTPLFTKVQLEEKEKNSLSRQWVFLALKEYGKSIGRPDLSARVLRQTFIANIQTDNKKDLAEVLGIGEESSGKLLERRRLTEQLPQSGVLFEATTKSV